MLRWVVFFSLLFIAFSASAGAYEPMSVIIRLERGPCYGRCPVYQITIYGDGTVRYDGQDHVRVMGAQTAVISTGTVKALADEIVKSGFFNLRDAYTEAQVTDAPFAIVYAAVGGRSKTVRHYLGDRSAPKLLETIETRIDEAAGVKRWTAMTAPSTTGQAAPAKAITAAAPAGPASVSGFSIARDTENQKITLRRTIAISLRDEAYALQQKGQARDAVIRYRQSLVYWPDTGLESYITPLEKRAGFTVSQYSLQTLQTEGGMQGGGAAGSKGGIVYATIRNRSTLDIIIQARGEPAGWATPVRGGEILIRPVQLAPNGEVTFIALRNGQVIASRSWYGNPDAASVVPSILFDDNLKEKLLVMTGLR